MPFPFWNLLQNLSQHIFLAIMSQAPKTLTSRSSLRIFYRANNPLYTSPMTACRSGNAAFDFDTHVDIATPGGLASPTGNPTSAHSSLSQSHFVDGPAAVDILPRTPQTLQHVYSPPGCSTSLSVTPLAVQDNTFQDIVDIQRKQIVSNYGFLASKEPFTIKRASSVLWRCYRISSIYDRL